MESSLKCLCLLLTCCVQPFKHARLLLFSGPLHILFPPSMVFFLALPCCESFPSLQVEAPSLFPRWSALLPGSVKLLGVCAFAWEGKPHLPVILWAFVWGHGCLSAGIASASSSSSFPSDSLLSNNGHCICSQTDLDSDLLFLAGLGAHCRCAENSHR